MASRQGFNNSFEKFLLHLMPVSWRVKLIMRRTLGYWPDIKNPRTFNEKVAHRKLKQYDDRYKSLADKFEVRGYVGSRIGVKYLSNVYAVINSISQLDFESLPECFVAKPTNQSNKIYFVRKKAAIDKTHLVRMVNIWLNSKFEYGIVHGEYWYNEMQPKVIFEEFLTDTKFGAPLDFKFYVFHGKAKAIQVDFDRFEYHKMNFYTPEWQQIPVRKGKCPNKLISPQEVRPAKLEEMISVAETLGSDFDFVRVDLYYLFETQRIVFGEMTFAPGSGYSRFIPEYYDLEFGKWW